MPDSLDFAIRLTIFCIIHSLLAAPRIKNHIKRLLKRPLAGYRLVYNLFSMVLFGWVMLAWQSTSVLYVLPGVWSLVLHGLQFIILWTALVCLRQTDLAGFLGTRPVDEDQPPVLTTTGCYAVVRHPLYLLGILFLLLNPIITTRWIVLTLFSIPYFIFGALLEERRMIRQLGETYRHYQKQVPFIVPRMKRQIIVD